jgi:hypothetical protein
MRLVRVVLALLAVGCSFTRGGSYAAPSDGVTAPRDSAAGDAATADASPPFCDPGDATLVACYAFEGSVLDGSSNHHDPNIALNISYAAGKTGQALIVGGTTEVDVPESGAFTVPALTIEAWIDLAAVPGLGNRAGILDSEGRWGFFVYDTGDLHCIAGGTAIATATVTAGQWTHVACTNDGATLTIYVNGRAAVAQTASALAGNGAATGLTLGGNNPPGGGNPLDGAIDQLRLYCIARTAAQICGDAGAVCN